MKGDEDLMKTGLTPPERLGSPGLREPDGSLLMGWTRALRLKVRHQLEGEGSTESTVMKVLEDLGQMWRVGSWLWGQRQL